MMARWVLVAILGIAGVACDHPIAIVGEGDVVSSSGERDCSLEDQPCTFRIVNEYQETYEAIPRTGFEFAGWDVCGIQDGNRCTFNVPAVNVAQFHGQTMPATTARFAPICADAPVSSFAALQQRVFNVCTACHGSNGGLSLAPANAYDNIVRADSTQTDLFRINPGSPETSYLYQKVVERSNPGSFAIVGAGMPRSGPPLSDDQLQALSMWITAGAPEVGRVGAQNEVETLLGFCAQ